MVMGKSTYLPKQEKGALARIYIYLFNVIHQPLQKMVLAGTIIIYPVII